VDHSQVPQATLSDPELDRAAVVDPYPQATLSDLELNQTAVVDPYTQATFADSEPDRTAVLDPYPQAIHSDPTLDRSAATSAMETHVESPAEGPGRAAVGGSRANDSTTKAAGSLNNPRVTSEMLPADVISTGVDSGVMPPAILEQMTWDASVMPVSAETDADVMFIAMGAETTEQSRWPSSTGVGTDMRSSTLALRDDEAVSPSPGSGVAPPLANEDRLDIVRIGPPAQGDTRQRRDQTAVQWGQGIPIRPTSST
jgi:hypothetical protein